MEPTNDLFDLSVNASGKEWIVRFARLVKWIIFLGILICALELIQGYIGLVYLQPLLKGNSLLQFSNRVQSVWLAIYVFLFLAQIFMLKKVSKSLSLAIQANDEQTFTIAFKYLYYYAFTGLAVLIGVVVFDTFNVFVSFKYYKVF